MRPLSVTEICRNHPHSSQFPAQNLLCTARPCVRFKANTRWRSPHGDGIEAMPMVQSRRALRRLWHGGLKRLVIFAVLGPLIYGLICSVSEKFFISSADFSRTFYVGCSVGGLPLLLSAGLDALFRNKRLGVRMFLMVYLGYFLNVVVWVLLLWDDISISYVPLIVVLRSFFGIVPAVACSLLSSEKQDG